MASILGRSYYILECCPEIAYSSLTQLLCGVASTGIWLILSNLSSLKLEILSSFSQNIFDLRKSVYMKNDTCTIVASSIKLHVSWNIFATFTNPQLSSISYENRDFDHLPKKLLENFRILNYTTPEYIYILRGFLWSFGVENYCVLSKKILMFFDLIRTSIGNKVFLLKMGDFTKKDAKKAEFDSVLMRVNIGNIVKIVKKAGENAINNGEINGFFIENEIIKEIKGFFKTMVSENHWTEVLAVLEAVFGKNKGNERKTEKKSEIAEKNEETKNGKKRVFDENLKKFLSLNGMVENKRFSKFCKIFLEIVKNGNSLMICGKMGRLKSTIVKAAAYVFSAINGTFLGFEKIYLEGVEYRNRVQLTYDQSRCLGQQRFDTE